MRQRIAVKPDARRKLLLAVAGLAAIGGPVLFGLANAQQGKAQSQAAVVSAPVFDVASIRADTSVNSSRVDAFRTCRSQHPPGKL